MKLRYRPSLILLYLLLSSSLFSQGIAIGEWRDDLPYYDCISVTDGGTRVYSATANAIFYYDKEDHSVERINKINGLSDVGLTVINYNQTYQILVIAYSDGNIDLFENNTIINISDIKRAPILGKKNINSIYFVDKYAYLSCGFGIVVLDIVKQEIRDTYYIGPEGSQINVSGLTLDDHDSIFAATDNGIYKAYSKDPNLANFASWRLDPGIDTTATFHDIVYFSGQLVVAKKNSGSTGDTLYRYQNYRWTPWVLDYSNPVMSLFPGTNSLAVAVNYFIKFYDSNFIPAGGVYSYDEFGNPRPNDVAIDKDNQVWIGDTYAGMIHTDLNVSFISAINLNGPLTNLVFGLTANGNDLYVAPGGRDNSYVPIYNISAQVYHFNGSSWYNVSSANEPAITGYIDVVTIAVDPNDHKRYYAGCWGSGLLEFYQDTLAVHYDESNSTLKHHSASTDPTDIRVGGVAFDSQGDLWVVNTHNNSCISRKSGNQWTGYTVPILDQADLGSMVIDGFNQKWIEMRNTTGNSYSILVFSDNGTPDNPSDDLAKKLNSADGNGAIPGNSVFAMAVDKKGSVWVGTESGIGVFYNPENVFSNQNFDCQRPLVQQGAYTQYLMENEMVTAIAVDGADRKWIGTDKGGVFLVSEDGTQQIYHFTAETSPLLSDRITSLAINPETGEVFIGTDKGLISFKSTATEGGETMGDVYAYPNPVKEDYSGWIAIKGLVTNAQVRITDVSGNLIYSTRAEGGQAIWDGKNFDGRKAKTGVYLVFAASDDGKEKIVTKILIIN
ncbi:MAG TPA: two-component regulator propeller domain-containing protein [Bacteroidales bacterium]|nr:two-component regulator propeller domain-containing protein [Bacteroidales bacterium]